MKPHPSGQRSSPRDVGDLFRPGREHHRPIAVAVGLERHFGGERIRPLEIGQGLDLSTAADRHPRAEIVDENSQEVTDKAGLVTRAKARDYICVPPARSDM